MCELCRAPGTMVALVTVLESNERREAKLVAKTFGQGPRWDRMILMVLSR